MKKAKLLVPVLLTIIFLTGCGEGVVDISEAKYEPKIVMEGYIYPGEKVENIKITRNFPLDTDIDVSSILLTSADVKIIDIETGKEHKLVFNPLKYSFEYAGNDLNIKSGNSYKLDINAVVDGKQLHASSVTTVPLQGLKAEQEYLGEMYYRETDDNGNIKKFNMKFTPSDKCEFYAISVTALDAAEENFIYDNAFFDVDSSDVIEDFDRYKHEYNWLQNSKYDAQTLSTLIEWHSIWFYGNYEVIIYAADQNFQHFIQTHGDVMEMDGNFHEPKFHIDGDGIGVFGSAVADTVHFKILK